MDQNDSLYCFGYVDGIVIRIGAKRNHRKRTSLGCQEQGTLNRCKCT